MWRHLKTRCDIFIEEQATIAMEKLMDELEK